MTKKHFIALADAIRDHNRIGKNTNSGFCFTHSQIETLADFCRQQNSQFDRARWLGYIAGENGPGGGSIKKD